MHNCNKKAKTKIALYEAGISFTHDRMYRLQNAGAKPGRIPRR